MFISQILQKLYVSYEGLLTESSPTYFGWEIKEYSYYQFEPNVNHGIKVQD